MALSNILVEALKRAFTEKDAEDEITTLLESGGTEVLTANPAAPVLNQQWILRVPQVEPTTATATIGDGGGNASVIEIVVPNPTIAKLTALGGTAVLTSIVWENFGGNVVNNTSGAGSFFIDFNDATQTVQNVIDLINVFSQTKISDDIATLGSDSSVGDNFAAEAGAMDTTAFSSNGTEEAYTYRVQGGTKIFDVSLT